MDEMRYSDDSTRDMFTAWERIRSDVLIREFRPHDMPEILRLDQVGRLVFADEDGPPTAPRLGMVHPEVYNPDLLWVAEFGQRVIGTAGLQPESQLTANLFHLRVEPKWRSRGLAALLVAWGAQKAQEHGFLKLILEAEIVTHRATAALEPLGFQYAGERRRGDRCALIFYRRHGDTHTEPKQ